MADFTLCPGCGAKLRLKNTKAARLRCPRCAHQWLVEATGTTPEAGADASNKAIPRPVSAEPAVPRFLNIGARERGFNIRKHGARLRQRAFPGMVVASADAFYLAVDPEALAVSRQESGGLFFNTPAADDTDKGPEERFFGVADPLAKYAEVEELPADITGHPDWPLTWKEGPVLIVPRQAVRALRTSLMLGGIEVNLEDARLLVFTPVFRRKQMAAYLTALGWEVQGAGTQAYQAQVHTKPAAARERDRIVRLRTIFGIVFLLGAGILSLWNWKWLQSVRQGPVPISAAELRRLDDPARLANPWVSFRFDNAQETGLGMVQTGIVAKIFGNERSRYILLQVQDRWLIAEVPEDHAGKEVTGYLDRWETPLGRETLAKIGETFPGVDFLPFQLDAHYAYRWEFFSLMGVVVLLAVGGILAILTRRKFKPQGM